MVHGDLVTHPKWPTDLWLNRIPNKNLSTYAFIPPFNIYWDSDTCLDLFPLKIKRCKEIILEEVWTQGKGNRKWNPLWSAQSYLSASVLWGDDIWFFHRSVLSKLTQLKDIEYWLKIQIPAWFWFMWLRCGTYESLFLTGAWRDLRQHSEERSPTLVGLSKFSGPWRVPSSHRLPPEPAQEVTPHACSFPYPVLISYH